MMDRRSFLKLSIGAASAAAALKLEPVTAALAEPGQAMTARECLAAITGLEGDIPLRIAMLNAAGAIVHAWDVVGRKALGTRIDCDDVWVSNDLTGEVQVDKIVVQVPGMPWLGNLIEHDQHFTMHAGGTTRIRFGDRANVWGV